MVMHTRTHNQKHIHYPKPALLSLFLVPLLIAVGVRAESLYEALPEPARQRSSVWLAYSSGLNDSRDLYGEADLVIAGRHHLLLGGGRSNLQSLEGRVDLSSFKLGYNSAYGEPFEFGLTYDYWGRQDELWTQTLSMPLRWNTLDWSFHIKPMLSRINLYTQAQPPRPRQLQQTNSQAVEGMINYYGPGNWEFEVSGGVYRYDGEPERLDNPITSALFSDVSLILAYGFPRSRLGAAVAYNFRAWRVGLYQESTVSLVDNTRLNVTSLKNTFYLGDDFSLNLNGGRVSAENIESYNFLTVGGQYLF
ncbi:MAG TPA: hypothetical protein EYP40_07015 [Chromatiales bacterium]|nr:hypothetical protein [Chromatiales bacterium]